MKRRRSGKPKAQAGPSKPGEGPRNPMLLFTVLSHLFKVIEFDLKDFRNFRLVCKDWAKASRGRWRQEVWLPLSDSSSYDDEGDISNQERGLSLHKFLEYMNDPKYELLSPTTCFKNYKVSFTEDLCFGSPGRLEFWSRMGPNMKKLEIVHCNISSCVDFARILFEFSSNLTSLQFHIRHANQFQMIPYPFHNPDSQLLQIPAWDERVRPAEINVQKNLTSLILVLCGRHFNLSWIYFLARLPNLKKLIIDRLPETTWIWGDAAGTSETQVFFQSFKIVREKMGSQYFSQLEELDILNMKSAAVDKLPTFLLPTLNELSFPLKLIKINIGYNDTVQEFKQILQMYQNTLESLTVYRSSHCTPFHNDSSYDVNMPHLTELVLIGPIIKSLNFLKNAKKLKILKLYSTCCKINQFSEIKPDVDVIGNSKFSGHALKNLVLDQLQSLTLESDTLICSAERVKALGKLCPNLKALRLGLKDDGFSMLCKVWEKIEELEVGPNELTEKGILGKAGGQRYQEPNITDLKDLKIFTMGFPLENSSKGRLTTDSILHGLLVCPNLKIVTSHVTPQASQLAQKRLASKCSFIVDTGN